MGETYSYSSKTNTSALSNERRGLLLVLIFALTNGLIYLFTVPPWQHYDEPTYFEYARFVSDHLSVPGPGEFDADVRLDIAQSMLQYGFYRELSYEPNLEDTSESVWIGQIQTSDRPLYFILTAIPIRILSFLGNQDVTAQLYAARFFSMTLFLSTILISFLIVKELVPVGNPIRIGVPAFMAFLPGFVDLMTSVNNDVGAAFAFSLFALASVRLVIRGPNALRAFGIGITMLVCVMTKNTVIWALPLWILALALSYRRLWKKKVITGIFFGGSVLLLLITLSWGDPAKWYRESSQNGATRATNDLAPLGKYAMQLTVGEGVNQAAIRQIIPLRDVDSISGKSVTFGAWMWATEPIVSHSFAVRVNNQTISEPTSILETPTFFSFQVDIPIDSDLIEVNFNISNDQFDSGQGILNFDGIVMAEGTRSLNIPVFDGPSGGEGTWGDQPFINIVRNGSAEAGWPYVRSRVETLARRLGSEYISPGILLTSVLDWQNTNWIYQASLGNLVQTFWGRFGWGHVSLHSAWYYGLTVLTMAIILGSTLQVIHTYTKPLSPKTIAITWLIIAAVVLGGSVLFRGFYSIPTSRVVLPTSRFIYPAIIPISIAIVTVWFMLPRVQQKIKSLIGLAGLYILNIASIWTIVGFYGGG
jgi:hypothetical protein